MAVNSLQFAAGLEVILIPALVGLASLVGLLPALSAYRTDVAQRIDGNAVKKDSSQGTNIPRSGFLLVSYQS